MRPPAPNGLLLALMALAIASPGALADGPAETELFGRWQQQVRSCELEQPNRLAVRCRALQLDQRNAEVVRLTLQADGLGQGDWMQLTMVGELVGGSEPMHCQAGRCALRQPLQVQLISLSLARFDRRGLVQTLPSTWPVRGRCRLDPAVLHCEASVDQSATTAWRVEAKLR